MGALGTKETNTIKRRDKEREENTRSLTLFFCYFKFFCKCIVFIFYCCNFGGCIIDTMERCNVFNDM